MLSVTNLNYFQGAANPNHPLNSIRAYGVITCTVWFVHVQWVSTLMIFLLKFKIFSSLTNDLLLWSTLTASVSLVWLLLFFTQEGSCFAYDVMILRVSGREWVVLNVVDSDQRQYPPPLRTAGHLIYNCSKSMAAPSFLPAAPTQYVHVCLRYCQVSQGGFCSG